MRAAIEAAAQIEDAARRLEQMTGCTTSQAERLLHREMMSHPGSINTVIDRVLRRAAELPPNPRKKLTK